MSYWIQQAIKRPGSLKKWLRKKYGNKAFNKDGTIKVTFLRKLLKREDVNKRIKRKIRLALTLRKLSKNKTKKRSSGRKKAKIKKSRKSGSILSLISI
jgi:hypothetical protein